MENILCNLFFENFRKNRVKCNEENQRIRSNLGILKKTLSNNQKRLLLRVIDDKDLICEKTARDNYIGGFRAASKIMIEILYLK